ncbi:hypothetical protein M231_00242 [Tremella mesenterica]|uniref:Mitochondrial import inner membrane translocase subunit TIM50 n=1 Tax=Tremella mesenterica TaxID=5217 RepID=A0A4Q1BX74_TREME|nr:hypothetical protein M231_00242 [Tremella mesenterica]
MLRLSTRYLISRHPIRPFHTSYPTTIKIRHSSPSDPPSPAEKPPNVPEDIIPSPPFEPEVYSPSSTPTSFPSSSSPSGETTSSDPPSNAIDTPLEPPTTPDLSKLPSLDIDPEAALPEPSQDKNETNQRTRAGKKEYISSIDRQRRMWVRIGMTSLVIGGLGAAWYIDQKDGEMTNTTHWTRFKTNLSEMLDVFNKPAFKTLLPDPLPAPHQRPYTLIVDLEGLLVSSTWDRAHGWRTAKRPGVDYFLGYLSQFYEIVLFTSQPLYTAAPVAEKLDPFTSYLPYKLFRESTRYVDGKVVKDLSYLNRDLSKVIVLDTNSEHTALQPDNAIIVKPWTGEKGDHGLVDMIPFLESIAMYNTPDVRPVLKAYEGKDIPIEYAKKEAETKRLALEQWERTHPKSIAGAGSGWVTSLFGSVASQSGQRRSDQPLTYLEQKRAEAQKQYQLEKKYYQDNAEEFARMIEEDKQRQLAEMKGSIWGFLTGGAATGGTTEKK